MLKKQIGDVVDPSTIPTATTFLPGFDGYTLTKDSTDPTTPVTITVSGAEITLYYTLPLTITIDDKTTTYNGDTQFGYSTSPEDILQGKVHVDGLWGNDSVTEYNYQPASGKDADTYTGSFTATPVVKNGDDTVTIATISQQRRAS